jgi:hydroxymethylpyrimidine kinase/phosphomethylpyrimidine kinase
MFRVLTIAGSDSGGGAGIQADIKTITALGGYGMSVITALTAQNTLTVSAVHEVPPEFIASQFDAVMTDIGADAAKTGMLSSPAVVRTVADRVRRHRIERLVVDPVMLAKSGDALLSSEGMDALIGEILPLALVVTPNISEAAMMAGIEISDRAGMEAAARAIARLGPRYVIVKGGHLPDDPVDLLYDGIRFIPFYKKRIDTKNTHGTGCTFSAAIAAGLAAGFEVTEAVARAEDYIETAITFSLNLGGGHGPVDHTAWFMRECDRYSVIEALKDAAALLVERNIAPLIPEVQSNLGYCLPKATDHSHVAAFPGRIIRCGEKTHVPSPPAFGASRHVANIILTIVRAHPDLRSVMNIRFSEDLVRKAASRHLAAASFDRGEEPEDVREAEGSSLAWGVEAVLAREGAVPDLIFDRGDLGKEPMIRVLGKDPADVARKVLTLLD